MPDLESFEKGFNLIKGNNYAGYILMDIEGIHEPVIKYKEYKNKLFKLTYFYLRWLLRKKLNISFKLIKAAEIYQD